MFDTAEAYAKGKSEVEMCVFALLERWRLPVWYSPDLILIMRRSSQGTGN